MLIIVTIKFSRSLGRPMYFFLFYLSFSDFCFSTTTAPRLIVDALSATKLISYSECMKQIFALHLFGCMEIFVLILMSADRYVAICKTLHYPRIMRRQICLILIILAWIGSFMHSTAQIILALRLPFCGPNLIDHYFCDLQPLLKLACMEIYVMNLVVVSKWGNLLKQLHAFDDLIHCHPAFAEKSQCRGEEKGPIHLHLSHHCSDLVLWSLYIHIYMPPNHLPHGQDGVGVLYHWNTLPQPTHLHSEERRG
ncbi:Olfactory receptor 4C11 [Sciurus carolinensis]|uniref:Olfactory receptor 4C11 n=1 Tax=Sciurus carolinensis TaxID=30640 RepID=A0AA41MVH1_SCICA|nr:Olfactory receptor 4C11 [Sciurus carolinensis]